MANDEPLVLPPDAEEEPLAEVAEEPLDADVADKGMSLCTHTPSAANVFSSGT